MRITLEQALKAVDQRTCATCRQPNGIGALTELGKMKFKSTVNWQIGKIIETVTKEAQEYMKVQNDRIVSFGNEVPAGSGQFRVPPDKDAEYQKEMAELRQQEIEVYGNPIALSDLGAKADEISGEIFASCGWLFTDGATEGTEKDEKEKGAAV